MAQYVRGGSDSDSDDSYDLISWTSPSAGRGVTSQGRGGRGVNRPNAVGRETARTSLTAPVQAISASLPEGGQQPISVGQALVRRLENLNIRGSSQSPRQVSHSRYDSTLIISEDDDDLSSESSISSSEADSSPRRRTSGKQSSSARVERASKFRPTSAPTQEQQAFLPSISSHGRLPDVPVPLRTFPASAPIRESSATTPVVSTPTRPLISAPTTSFYHAPPAKSPLMKLFDAVELECIVIAHDRDLQKCLDDALIPFGTQWEIYRGIQRHQWDAESVKQKARQLRGLFHPPRHEDTMPKVHFIMTGNRVWKSRQSDIAQQYDREQAALTEKKGRGLGLMGPFQGSDPEKDWYGGWIQQIVRLVDASNSSGFELRLEPLEMQRSNRLGRFYGSRRVLHVRIGDKILRNKREALLNFLKHKFILAGRVFVPLPPKDDGLYMVEVREDFERIGNFQHCDQLRLTYGELLEWHNPPGLNNKQPMAKYHTRFALALSTTIPAIEFKADNIFRIRDEVTSDWHDDRKDAPAEKTLTDGCGFINRAALLIIAKLLGVLRPAAIQGRIAGAKGLWIEKPDDDNSEPKIWIRDSQNKIEYRSLDRSHRILDLVQVSLPINISGQHHLSMQSLMNLSWNGVPDDVFIKFMKDGLDTSVQPLMTWSGEMAMPHLWHAIERQGKVSVSRLARIAGNLSRVLGLSGREYGNLFDDTDKVPDDGKETYQHLSQPYTGRNDLSGAPVTISESALELVQAGFRPDRLNALRSKLKVLVTETINGAIRDFKIPLPQAQAAEALVMPDPLGVLKEGEVFFRSSQPIEDQATMTSYNVVTGDVLIGRHPIRLPSDIQKVRAVNYPDLHRWPDVFIVPIAGSSSHCSEGGQRTLMSILSGGDVDGDTLFMIWTPELVDPFRNSKLTLPPKNFKEDNFERSVESVQQVMTRIASLSARDGQIAFQSVLLLGLTDGKVGTYSHYHDSSIWRHGYNSPEAIRHAYMSNNLLDSTKTGLRLRTEVGVRDAKAYPGRPFYMDPDHHKIDYKECHPDGPSVLAQIFIAGKRLSDQLLKQYDDTVPESMRDSLPPDLDLLRPFRRLDEKTLTEAESRELSIIKQHVDAAYEMFVDIVRKKERQFPSALRSPSKTHRRRAKHTTFQKVDDMLPVTIEYHKPLKSDVNEIRDVDVEDIMASYAYMLNENFGFMVAFRVLCKIKARQCEGGLVPSIRAIDEFRSVPSSVGKFLRNVTQTLYTSG